MTTPPVILLAQPQLGENIGTTARAMLNCGFTELRLIDPRDGWPGYTPQNSRHKGPHKDAESSYTNAIAASAGAVEVIENAKTYETLEEATNDLHFVLAATARPRDMVKPVFNLTEGIKEIPKTKSGILFGCEKAGLLNDDIALCDAILTVPLNKGFTSLNLSQAVLLCCHAWFTKTTNDETHNKKEKQAEKEDLYFFLNRLEEKLGEKGYFDKTPQKREKMARDFRNIFSRNNLTESEINTLHGILGSLTKD